ncbi:MAG: Xaa-Pro aminopeptidase [Bacteroidales bacterium]|jgi:Xaa-Pro aminopeptidase|nr:Xaa-Pro aminopeptidase [Bacteroidales bacterium]MCI2121126.1 Xaa-Pro aminopeptidase [Bacteroidales bacterium]MCI2144941.1 Xaa-Pro aminopeptidase [Bacteroidales bacterium]
MFSKETYMQRREKLLKDVPSGLILFLGNSEAPCNYPDNTYDFRQDSCFLYFFGLDKPDLAAIMDAENGDQIIFGDDVTMDDIIWMGPQMKLADEAAQVGITHVEPFAKLEEYVKKSLEDKRTLHFTPPYRGETKILLNALTGIPFAEMKSAASVPLIKAIVKQRMVKEHCEIEEMDRIANVGYMMQYTVMKLMKPGVPEQVLAGAVEGVCRSYAYIPSFTTILSQHGETMHNHLHNCLIGKDRLCVIDCGAESNMHYASDFTRTLPGGGKFSQKQADIYSIVSTANQYSHDNCRPGVTHKSIHMACSKIILQGLKNLGLVEGDIDEAVNLGVQGLFMPHGLGHAIGMDVHDMEGLGEDYVGYDDTVSRSPQLGLGSLRMARTLETGNVVSDEPGIYFIPALIEKWKSEGKFKDYICYDKLESYYDFGGIRLEDDLLITAGGCRTLGAKRLPITVKDVEEAMKDN